MDFQFRAQFDHMIENVKRNVAQTVVDSVCREIDVQAGVLYELFTKKWNDKQTNFNQLISSFQSQLSYLQQQLSTRLENEKR